jgi:perosamine synthetase
VGSGNRGFVATFRAAAAELKQTADEAELDRKRIPFANGSGWLVPVCELHAEDRELIEALGRWRTLRMSSFPTQFTVTYEGTRSWLREQVLDNPERVTFLIVQANGATVGHCGFAQPADEGILKLDNVLRGEEIESAWLMAAAMVTLFTWAKGLGAVRIQYPLMDTNVSMMRFLRRFGQVTTGSTPLRRHVDADRVVYLPLADGDSGEPDAIHNQMSIDLTS